MINKELMYNVVSTFNNYEKKLIVAYNEILDEENCSFSEDAEFTMMKDNSDFAEYLFKRCKTFKNKVSNYSENALKDIYISFYASRFNTDCFSFNGFSEIENTFIERYIDKHFAIERQFEVQNNVASFFFYDKVILNNWNYTICNIDKEIEFADLQDAFDYMKKNGYRFLEKEYINNNYYYSFYKEGLTRKHGCRLEKAIEKEYGKHRMAIPFIKEYDSDM